MKSISLFTYSAPDIKVSIEAYFDGDKLIIDGYDIGKRVEEYWGDSDYEYVLTIPPAGVDFLFGYFNLAGKNKEDLLNSLAVKFNTNTCYSDIQKLLSDNGITYESFSWR
ncbi:MAG: hypothetical protein KF725_13095 [Cyclobacteriaceae bacterium]|nr:hypothetical protein [Cyclobacteriaceae bacterium]UYN85437.1 MAG: hypothetical protein KIT51_11120 [Cyclobacteriaceae bacterium]